MPKPVKIEIEAIRAKDDTSKDKAVTVTLVYAMYNSAGVREWVKEVDIPLNIDPRMDTIPDYIVTSNRRINVY